MIDLAGDDEKGIHRHRENERTMMMMMMMMMIRVMRDDQR